MRLLELRLVAFGPFTDRTLDLASDEPGFHVLHGRNEAGKSTALRAVAALLFGIPRSTPDDHVHEAKDLRIGARLQGPAGLVLDVVRRKGMKETLLTRDGAKADETALRRLLGGVSEEMFASMFGLDHERLRAGAEALLLGGGGVGESLFGAGLGGRAVRTVLDRLAAEADDLFRPQAKNPKLNEAIKAYHDARKRAQESGRDAGSWTAQKAAIEDASALRDRLDERRRALKAEQRRLQRGRGALPFVEKRESLSRAREALGRVLPIDAAAAARRGRAEAERAERARQTERLESELARLEERRAALVVPEELAGLDDERAQRLQDDLGAYRRALSDRPRLEGALRSSEEEAREVLLRLGRDVPLAETEPLRIETAAEKRIQALALRRTGLEEKLAAARRARQAAEVKRDQTRTRLEALAPAGPALPALGRAVAAATAEGDLEERLRSLAQAISAKESRASRQLRALGLAVQEPAMAAALPVPAPETIAAFERDTAAIERRRTHCAERERELERTIARAASETEDLRRDGEVPTQSDLERARERRDRAVQLLRAAAEGPRAARAKAAPDPSGGAGAVAERAVAEADAVADALRAAADRVARLATLDEERSRAERDRSAAARERVELDREAADLGDAWRHAWARAGVEPRAPAEMRGFPERHAALVAMVEEIEEDRRAHETLAGSRAAHQEMLRGALAAAGESKEARRAELTALLELATSRLDTLRETDRARRELLSQMEELDGQIELLRREEAEQASTSQEWRRDWAASVARLGLPDGAVPEEANAVLGELTALFKKLDEAKGLKRRIDGIDRDGRAFEADVRALARRHAGDLADLPVESVADEILRRHREARRNAREAEGLDRDIAQSKPALGSARELRTRAEAELAELVRSAGVATLDELVNAERTAAEARDLDRALADVATQLRALGDGLGIEELGHEARAIDPAAATARLDELADEIQQAEDEFSDAVRTLGSREQGLRELEQPTLAAEAASEAQGWAARIRGYAERYVRVRLAAVLLEREIERYRERNQGPLLRRAGELFPRLTAGRYASLRTDYDEADRLVLRCVRAPGAAGRSDVVGVEALSDGTRDQLYLALRIAALEHWLEANDPMPLVLDDVLIHFDDERAQAALEVLGELAGKTQVLFFTHHARLEELARKAVPEGRLHVHAL